MPSWAWQCLMHPMEGSRMVLDLQVCGGHHNKQGCAAVDAAGPGHHCGQLGHARTDHRHQALHHREQQVGCLTCIFSTMLRKISLDFRGPCIIASRV